ncbi:putative mt-a70 family protein [Lasiodiplodia theobromae]|nr:putative mt-a70 family protein [Lasiodiplodia theobromae]
MYGITWKNKDLTVFLVDIPESIAAAQVLKLQRVTSYPISMKPQIKPYDNQPVAKTEKARKNMENQTDPRLKLVFDEIRPYVVDALSQIKTALDTKLWCEDRYYTTKSFYKQRMEQQEHDPNGEKGHTVRDSAHDSDTDATDRVTTLKIPWQLLGLLVQGYPHTRTAESQDLHDEKPSFPENFSRFFYNPNDNMLTLSYVPDNAAADQMRAMGRTMAYGEERPQYDKNQHFYIPPDASFILGDCTRGKDLDNAVQYMHAKYEHPKQFDFIVMDPPWPNSSAQDSSYYQVFQRIWHMDNMFNRMDLDMRIAPGGFIGVWVTNNQKVRDYVLGPDGLFARWGVAFVEEWIWIKTTVDGTPVIDLDSTWRKPWECFLIGQAPDKRNTYWPPVGNWHVNKRVIAAVPDTHSRKPCLKPIIEKIWRKSEGQYSALEVFGRVCISGWLVWGNEATKLNYSRYWVSEGENMEGVEKWSAEEHLKASRENKSEEEMAAVAGMAGQKRKFSSLH